MPEWSIYQAESYQEIFMYDHNVRLRWFPNIKTLKAYGYTTKDAKVVPISWFYDKTIVESIEDVETNQCYPSKDTPHYQEYRRPIPEWDEIKQEIALLEEGLFDIDKKTIEIQEKLEEIKVILG